MCLKVYTVRTKPNPGISQYKSYRFVYSITLYLENYPLLLINISKKIKTCSFFKIKFIPYFLKWCNTDCVTTHLLWNSHLTAIKILIKYVYCTSTSKDSISTTPLCLFLNTLQSVFENKFSQKLQIIILKISISIILTIICHILSSGILKTATCTYPGIILPFIFNRHGRLL